MSTSIRIRLCPMSNVQVGPAGARTPPVHRLHCQRMHGPARCASTLQQVNNMCCDVCTRERGRLEARGAAAAEIPGIEEALLVCDSHLPLGSTLVEEVMPSVTPSLTPNHSGKF